MESGWARGSYSVGQSQGTGSCHREGQSAGGKEKEKETEEEMEWKES